MGTISVFRASAIVLALAFSACGVSSGLSDEPQGNLPGASGDAPFGDDDPTDGDGDGDQGDGDQGDGDQGDGDDVGDGDVGELPPCGDGTDECDPEDLGGETCQSLGAFGGTLACDPMTCTFDMSMCVGGGNSGSGGTGGSGFFGGQSGGGDSGGSGMFGGGN